MYAMTENVNITRFLTLETMGDIIFRFLIPTIQVFTYSHEMLSMTSCYYDELHQVEYMWSEMME
jgi:hypothetical protein